MEESWKAFDRWLASHWPAGFRRLRPPASDEVAARAAGMLVLQTRRYRRGLSDRTCMALGIAMNLPVLTADGEWRRVTVEGLRLEHIR